MHLPIHVLISTILLAATHPVAAFAGMGTANTPPSPASANEPIVPLDEWVISATRTRQEIRDLPSAVTRVSSGELRSLQITQLSSALGRETGVVVVNTGAVGAQSSIFLRGASSHQTLFVVDGLRMSDRSASYSNFLGGAGLAGLERIEVLRGPQSTLYGSSAAGGVIVVETAHAPAGTSGTASATAGSFGTWETGLALRHGGERVGISGALTRHVTDNDRPGNAYESRSLAGRIDGRPTDRLRLGATWRGEWSEYEEPGSRLFAAPGTIDFSNHLATGFVELATSETNSTRLTAGLHRRRFSFAAPWGTSSSSNTRVLVDLLNTWRPSAHVEILYGGNHERARFTVNGEPSRDELFAGFVSAVLRPSGDVTLTLGGRHDHHETAGGAATWRVGAAWRVAGSTKLRANLGTAFVAPGSDDRFGVAQWGQLANPDLAPEKARGWDAGIDQGLFNDRVRLGATWFRNTFRGLFDWETVDFTTFEGRIVNRARASTQGVELSMLATPASSVRTRLAYTLLEARNDSSGARLFRRPRHTADADFTWQAHSSVLLGLGARMVVDRVEGAGPIEDYTTVRVHASWQARDDLRLRLRVENALDEAYEETLGYPALPLGVFGSVEWTF